MDICPKCGQVWLIHLSPREAQVAQALIADTPVKAIAANMDITESAVREYAKRLKEKIGTSGPVGLLRFFYSRRLLDDNLRLIAFPIKPSKHPLTGWTKQHKHEDQT